MTGIEVAIVSCLLAAIGFSWHVLIDAGHVEAPDLFIAEVEPVEEVV